MNKHSLMMVFLAVALALGFTVDTQAQSAAPTQQQPSGPQTPPDDQQRGSDRRGVPSVSPSADRPQAQTDTRTETRPGASVESRTETRTDRVDRNPAGGGKFLGMDPMVALLIGAGLLVIIVVALVAMSKRSEEVHTEEIRSDDDDVQRRRSA